MSISRYFTEMLDPAMSWDDVAAMVREWDGQFCLKGVMSVEDAKRAADIGCTGIVISNHGGRQLDGSRSAFDQLSNAIPRERPGLTRRLPTLGETTRAERNIF